MNCKQGNDNDQWAVLRNAPDLVPRAVEEGLRYDAPFHWFKRVTTRPVAVGGVTIPRGENVLLVWASANRDERRWPDGESFQLDREPLRHLSFSAGVHRCLGATLARLELAELLRRLIVRLEDYELLSDPLRRVTPSERTITAMPVRVAWATGTTTRGT